MRLIDADAYAADMKDRQEAAWKWRNEAIAEEDEVKLARAEGAYTAFTEAKLTMDKHIISPWHRVEDELPKDNTWCVFISENKHTFEQYRWIGTYSEEWGFQDDDNFMVDNVKYWMPLPDPPKEETK